MGGPQGSKISWLYHQKWIVSDVFMIADYEYHLRRD